MNEDYDEHWTELDRQRKETAKVLRWILVGLIALIGLAATVEIATAGAYIEDSLEPSCSPGFTDCELQNRIEVGWVFRPAPKLEFSTYIYHESDPRNGFDGDGWERETENGVPGFSIRYEF